MHVIATDTYANSIALRKPDAIISDPENFILHGYLKIISKKAMLTKRLCRGLTFSSAPNWLSEVYICFQIHRDK